MFVVCVCVNVCRSVRCKLYAKYSNILPVTKAITGRFLVKLLLSPGKIDCKYLNDPWYPWGQWTDFRPGSTHTWEFFKTFLFCFLFSFSYIPPSTQKCWKWCEMLSKAFQRNMWWYNPNGSEMLANQKSVSIHSLTVVHSLLSKKSSACMEVFKSSVYVWMAN